MKAELRIGEMAKQCHLNPKTIRYYEDVGLLPKPKRSDSGYRLYSSYEIERLRLVKRAKLLGLSLAQIRELVEYAIDGRCSVLEHRLLALIEAKLVEVDQRIGDLAAFRKELMVYRGDLSRRVGATGGERPSTRAGCQCIPIRTNGLDK